MKNKPDEQESKFDFGLDSSGLVSKQEARLKLKELLLRTGSLDGNYQDDKTSEDIASNFIDDVDANDFNVVDGNGVNRNAVLARLCYSCFKNKGFIQAKYLDGAGDPLYLCKPCLAFREEQVNESFTGDTVIVRPCSICFKNKKFTQSKRIDLGDHLYICKSCLAIEVKEDTKNEARNNE